MLAFLEDILARIEDGSLVPNHYYRTIDCDAALDARDSDLEFESAWLALHAQFQEAWAFMPVSKVVGDIIARISRGAFEVVSRATCKHEIASYVSEDLDLISKAHVLGWDDPFLSWLWDSYDQGRFPQPPWQSSALP